VVAGNVRDAQRAYPLGSFKGLKPLVQLIVGIRIMKWWLVTFVTHNARVSGRMAAFHVEAGEPGILGPDDQKLVAATIVEACRKHRIPVMAGNVLPDHVHLVVGAVSPKDLAEHIRKIKGYSARAFVKARDFPAGYHVWAQKFNRRRLPDANTLAAAVDYVERNHYKHLERWGAEVITTYEETVRPVLEPYTSTFRREV
jgi:REP element-mobilizing transposase RayT